MMFRWGEKTFECLQEIWESPRLLRTISGLLVVVFIVSMGVIELNRQALLPRSLSGLPTNHFHAVDLALTCLLFFEVVALVFTLAHSVSYAVGKQIEILSLILIRQSFKELAQLPEPLQWVRIKDAIPMMLAESFGALMIFVVLGIYYRQQRHIPITSDAQDNRSFVTIKKLIALALLCTFAAIGINDIVLYIIDRQWYPFFETFYMVIIFSDVLVVLISLRYSSTYRVVFRNSGFAVATLLLRLALTAPRLFMALLGLTTALFALGLTIAYNRFATVLDHQEAPKIRE